MLTPHEKIFWGSIPIVVLIKLLISLLMPMTADEAYFVTWGEYPAWGYYDHPPMTGWIMYLTVSVDKSPLVLRFPTIISTVAVGIGLYVLLRKIDRQKAPLVGLLYLASPLNLFMVPVVTDMPLVLLSFVSVACLVQAVSSQRYGWYALSGAALGLGFLTKYLAVLLALSYAIVFFALKEDRRNIRGFLILFLSAVPFVLQNLYWNYTHSWATLSFNLFNRNVDKGFSLWRSVIFLLFHVYLFTPVLLFFVLKWRRGVSQAITESRTFFPAFVIFTVPFLVLLLISPWTDPAGISWLKSFYPFLYLSIFFLFPTTEFLYITRAMIFYSLSLIVIAMALFHMSWERYLKPEDYAQVVIAMNPHSILRDIGSTEGSVCAADDYNAASLLSYHSGKYFAVFGEGWVYGRQDDIITDFRSLNGRDFVILLRGGYDGEDVSTFFERCEKRVIEHGNATWTVVRGYQFRFPVYRDLVLQRILDKYYELPAWLPTGSCYFRDKYFDTNSIGWHQTPG
jgi:hypothetical protein